MARRLSLALLVLLPLLAAPLSAGLGGLPAPLGTTERVSSFAWVTPASETACSSWDPVLGQASLAPLSQVTHTLVSGGTRYDLHLESLFGGESCGAVDLSFVSAYAPWPTTGMPAGGPISSDCGATGYFQTFRYSEGIHLGLSLDVPAACAAGVVGQVWLSAHVAPLRSSAYMACAPVDAGLVSCAGASEREDPYTCPNGERPSQTYVTAVLYAYRGCDYASGGDYVTLQPFVPVAWVEARESSCTLYVSDYFFGVLYESVACPDELGEALYEADWGNLLP